MDSGHRPASRNIGPATILGSTTCSEEFEGTYIRLTVCSQHFVSSRLLCIRGHRNSKFPTSTFSPQIPALSEAAFQNDSNNAPTTPLHQRKSPSKHIVAVSELHQSCWRMAARPLEAGSLSTINYLAANPPQYPYHPELREPLTLYISRVPGTQGACCSGTDDETTTTADSCLDIILSTFRPQKKNVTGTDIASSLYYVHLDAPEDGLLAVPHQPQSVVSPRSSSESVRSTIPRKPLPGSAKLTKPDGDSDAMHSGVPHTRAPSGVSTFGSPTPGDPTFPSKYEVAPREDAIEGYRENPVFRKHRPGGSRDGPGFPSRPTPSAAPIPRKSLAPTPLGVSGTGHDAGMPVSSDARVQGRPVTPTQPGTLSAPPATSPLYINNPSSPGRRPAASMSFSLTIIRRDTTSGAQTNVGKVSSFQTNVPTPDSADPSLDPDNMGALLAHAQKVDIRLETSGYAKYRDLPSRADVDAYRPTSGHSFAQQMMKGGMVGPAGPETSPTPNPAYTVVEEGFSRQVVMSYGTSWKSSLKKAFQRKDRPGSPGHTGGTFPEDHAARRSLHARHGSASTIGSVDSADGRHSPNLITHPGPGLKPKGYVFLSPWNGRCEFWTSANGRSLKCRHLLDPASARLDPREVAQSIRDAQTMGRSRGDELSSALVGAKPVSELRFNLPQGGLHRNPGPGGPGGSKGGRWDAKNLPGPFSKLLHHRPRSSDEDSDGGDDYEDYDNDTPLDLSLGKEHAGGGNRGRRAKLGKLIVHDEGLKMLDLVVAANIGVWWTTWGRML